MIADVRITVYDAKMAGVLKLDASGDLAGAGVVLTYEDTPTGCGASQITLGLAQEDVVALKYWAPMNIVEISACVDTLQAPISSGATKLYVTSTDPWDPAKGEDAQLAYINGAHLTMRIPVTGIGSDGGGPFLTVGAPLGGGSIPAEGAGAIIGRRRYCGRIVRRARRSAKAPQTPISLIGLGAWLKGNGTFASTATDIGAVIYNSLSQFSSRWPFFTIAAGNFPTVGTTYTGSANRYDVSRFVADVLQGVTNGDTWVLRVGHDRTPRLMKLYTSATNTYTYAMTLNQGITAFEALNAVVEDDGSGVYNSVEVIGDVDPLTKLNVAAIVQDAASITAYGQIDHDPVTNTKCKTQAQCVAAATALLNASSISSTNCQVRVFTRNDDAVTSPPGGTANGDIVRGVHALTVTGNYGTGTSANNAPDSEIVNYLTLWVNGGLVYSPGTGPNGSNQWATNTPGSVRSATGPSFNVGAKRPFVFSHHLDANGVTGGTVYARLLGQPGNVVVAQVTQTNGVTGRVASAPFTIPVGVTSLQVQTIADTCTYSGGGAAKFAQPMLSDGSGDKAYVANNATAPVTGLVASAKSSFTADGDSYQDIKYAAIEPDHNASTLEATNAAATALHNNTAQAAYLDQYVVSAAAFPPTVSTGSLTVNAPAFNALFAQGSTPVAFAASSFALVASQTNWAWLNPNGSWTIRQDTVKVAGAIPYAFFQCSATGVMGWTQIASIGVIIVGTATMSPMPAAINAAGPTYNGASCTLGTQVSGAATASQPYSASFADWSGAPPDWFDSVYQVLRNHAGLALLGDPVPYAATSNVLAQTAQLPAGVARVDIGFFYLGHDNKPSATTWPSQFDNIAVGTIANTTMKAMPSGIQSAGPTVNSSSWTRAASKGANQVASITAALGDFGPKPTWLDMIVAVVRDNSGTTASFDVDIAWERWTVVSATITLTAYKLYAALGSAVDVGFYYRDATGQVSAVTWPSGLSNITDPNGDLIDTGDANKGLIHVRAPKPIRDVVVDEGSGVGSFLAGKAKTIASGGTPLPLLVHDTAVQWVQQRNLIRNGIAQLGDWLGAGGGWTASGTVTSNLSGTYGPLTIQHLNAAASAYAYQDVPVKPNTDYSYAMLVNVNTASQSIRMRVFDTTVTTELGAATQPSGALSATGFYLNGATLANSDSSSTLFAWKLIAGRFNSGSRSTVRVLVQNTGGSTQDMYLCGAMLWEGTKWQDYVDTEPVAGSLRDVHVATKWSGSKVGGIGSITDTMLNGDFADRGDGAGVKFSRSTSMRTIGSPISNNSGTTCTLSVITSIADASITARLNAGTYYTPDGGAISISQTANTTNGNDTTGATTYYVGCVIAITAAGTYTVSFQQWAGAPTLAQKVAFYGDGFSVAVSPTVSPRPGSTATGTGSGHQPGF